MWQTFDTDRAAVATALEEVFAGLRQTAVRFPWDEQLLQMAEPYTTAGKLFRGTLVLGAYRAMIESSADANSNSTANSDVLSKAPISLEAVTECASAIELYGSAVLMQDDIMDRDKQRRGMQSVHVQIAELARQQGYADADHFGESLAMCLSDVLLFAAGSQISRAQLPAETRQAVQLLAEQELRLLALAQIEDARMAAAPIADLTQEQVIAMFAGKTGRYSVLWSLETAAVLAGVSQEARQQLIALGEEIGVLYQLRDDDLGIFGETQKTGKSTTSDITEGKKTLYHLFLHQLPASPQRDAALQTMGSADATPAAIAQVKAAIQELGVADQVAAEIEQRKKRVETQLDSATVTQVLTPAVQQLLRSILQFVVTREK